EVAPGLVLATQRGDTLGRLHAVALEAELVVGARDLGARLRRDAVLGALRVGRRALEAVAARLERRRALAEAVLALAVEGLARRDELADAARVLRVALLAVRAA